MRHICVYGYVCMCVNSGYFVRVSDTYAYTHIYTHIHVHTKYVHIRTHTNIDTYVKYMQRY